MKLLIILAQKEDGEKLFQKLCEEKLRVIKSEGKEGALLNEVLILFVYAQEKDIKKVLSLTQKYCSKRTEYLPSESEFNLESPPLEMPPIPLKIGGASVFIIKPEKFQEF